MKFSRSGEPGDDPATLPIVLSDTFPVRCPDGKSVNLKESGLLDGPLGRRDAAPPQSFGQHPTTRPASVSMPAASKVELPEPSLIGTETDLFELPLSARRLKDTPVADDSIGPVPVEQQAPVAQDRDWDMASDANRDARLTKIIEAWPVLPATLQSTILALVRASVGK